MSVVVALGACGNEDSKGSAKAGSTSSTSSTPDAAVRIGFSSWIGYGAFHVAEEKGFFKKHGVDVKITISEDAAQRLVAIKAGRLDATATTVDTYAAAAARDAPLVQVAAIDASNGGDGIIAEKSIASPADLKGKSVAVNEGTIEEFFLAYVLKQNGLSLGDVKVNNLKPDDAGAAFAAGKVPVAVTYEPWLSKARANPNSQVLVSTKDYPDLIVDSLAFSRDFLKKHPASVRAFLDAYEEGVNYIKTNPADANAIMAKVAKQTPSELAAQLKTIRFYDRQASRKLFGTAAAPGPIFDLFTSAGEFWKETGETQKVGDAADAIDPSFINGGGS